MNTENTVSAGNGKLKLKYPVIVEGKYDRARLCSVAEGVIVTTDGFGIFKDNEKAALIRALARKTPIIILTDPDGAGGVIRSFVCGILPPERVRVIRAPRVEGVEARKGVPSAEGLLGVEGLDSATLRRLLLPYAVAEGERNSPERINPAADTNRDAGTGAETAKPICTSDLMRDRLTGCRDSVCRRDALAAGFGLPPGMNAKALIAALKYICTYDEYTCAVARLDSPGGKDKD